MADTQQPGYIAPDFNDVDFGHAYNDPGAFHHSGLLNDV
jgi:hypothetical protein